MKKFVRRVTGALLIVIATAAIAFATLIVARSGGTRDEVQQKLFASALYAGAAVTTVGGVALILEKARRGKLAFLLALVIVFPVGMYASRTLLAISSHSTQKRTMADIRTVASALEARATDLNAYPSTRSIEELAALLEPAYIGKLPRTDAWRYPLKYEARPPQDYCLGSGGRGGAWERAGLFEYTPNATTTFGSDIVFCNGAFIQYPEGTQQP